MIILTLAKAIIFAVYMFFLWVKFKFTLFSISDSWYKLDGMQKHLFTLFCWFVGFLMFFQTDGSTGLFFLSGAGLCFTGTAAMFKEPMTKVVHYAGALTFIFGAFAAIFFERGFALPFIIFCPLAFGAYFLKNRIYWIEVVASILILYGLLK